MLDPDGHVLQQVPEYAADNGDLTVVAGRAYLAHDHQNGRAMSVFGCVDE